MYKILDNFKDKEILITGGLGFIGSNLAIQLAKVRCNITILDSLRRSCGGNIFNISPVRDKIRLHKIDLNDKKIGSIVKNKDFIFNLAGHSSHRGSMLHPEEDKDINVFAQKSLLEACRKNNANVKIIYTGTRGQYGRVKRLPVKENQKMIPLDINGKNKLIAEKMHLKYHKLYGIKVCCLRLTNVYGPRHQMRNSDQGFIGWFIRLALDNQKIKIFGEGNQLRDIIYVSDVIRALLTTMGNKKTNGESYNVASGRPISIIDIAKKTTKIAGSGKIKIVPFPNEKKKIEIGDFYAEITKIKKATGWVPIVSLEKGLKTTIDFYKVNKKFYW